MKRAEGPARSSSSTRGARTTVAIAEQIAGKDNVLHLDIAARHRHRALQRAFHLCRRAGLASTRTSSPSTPTASTRLSRPTSCRWTSARKITGVSVAKLQQAAEWAYKPKATGAASPDDARLREGNHLGQRQLPDSVGAAGPGARDSQRRPARHRLRAHGRTPGGLHAAAAIPTGDEDLRRPGAHQRQGPDDDLVGLQQLPDQQQRAAAARSRAAPHPDRQGGDGQGARGDSGADGRRHLRRHHQGWPVRHQHQPLSDDAVATRRT